MEDKNISHTKFQLILYFACTNAHANNNEHSSEPRARKKNMTLYLPRSSLANQNANA